MNYENIAEELFNQLRDNCKTSLNEFLNDFNRGEIGVLGYLVFDKNMVTSGELSEKLDVTTARMASILNSLENKGYIKRNIDIYDKRKTLVAITDMGVTLAYKIKKEMTNKIITLVKEIGYDDIKEYIRISLEIRKVLNKQQ